MHNRLNFCAMLTCFAVLAHAQSAQPPKPSPELRFLGYWVGKWSCEGINKVNNTKTAGKSECEWFAGGVALVCQFHSTVPEDRSVGVYGYNPVEKAYIHYSYSRQWLFPNVAKGQRTGATLTLTRDAYYQQKPAKFQSTYTQDQRCPRHA